MTFNGDLEETPAWKTMSSRHAEEEIVLRQGHVEKQYIVLQQLLAAQHDSQCKELVLKQER